MPVIDEREEPNARRTPWWVLGVAAATITSSGVLLWSWNEPEVVAFLNPPRTVRAAPARMIAAPAGTRAAPATQIPTPAFNWDGRWTGKWDGVSAVAFTISHAPNSSDYRVLYEWQEGSSGPKNRRWLKASAGGSALVCRELSIAFEFSGKGMKNAVAYGQFPKRRIAKLVRTAVRAPNHK